MSKTETAFSIGDPVKVRDFFLAELRRMAARSGSPIVNHHGWVHSIDGNTVMVLFPIDDHHPNEHSQLAPYPAQLVQPRFGPRLQDYTPPGDSP